MFEVIFHFVEHVRVHITSMLCCLKIEKYYALESHLEDSPVFVCLSFGMFGCLSSLKTRINILQVTL